MIEVITCPNCGKTIKSNITYGLPDARSVTCNACKQKCSLGQWRRNAIKTTRLTPPPPPTRIPTPPTQPLERAEFHDELSPSDSRTFDLNLVLGLWIAGGGLLLTCLSPFFKWISVGAGGVTGLAGDGKILLAVTVVAIGAFIFAVAKRNWMTSLLIPVQGWGTVVVFWMGALLWKMSSLVGKTAVEENVFAAVFSAVLVSPGVGLYVGLIGGIFTGGALAYVTGRQLFRRKRHATFFVTQAIAVCVGVLLVIFVGPYGLPKSAGNRQTELFSFGHDETAADSVVDAAIGKPFVLGHLQITPIGFEFVTLREGSLFGDFKPRKTKSFVFTFAAKNISEGQVFSPYSSSEVTDEYGNRCPDPTDASAFSTLVSIDANEMFHELRPGESANVKLAFDPALESAREYTCRLTTQTSNQMHFEKWQIKFAPPLVRQN